MNLSHASLLFLFTCLWLSTGVADAAACRDKFEITFGAKPQGSPMWVAPVEPFVADLPVRMEAEQPGIQVSLHLKRSSAEILIAEFGLTTPANRRASLYQLVVNVDDPKELHTNVLDELGNGWAVSIRSACPKMT